VRTGEAAAELQRSAPHALRQHLRHASVEPHRSACTLAWPPWWSSRVRSLVGPVRASCGPV